MKFYLVRGRNSNYVTLTNFVPKRNTKYDNYVADNGKVFHQDTMGSWYYYGEEGREFVISHQIPLGTIKYDFGVDPEKILPLTCYDLTDGVIIKLEDAEAL